MLLNSGLSILRPVRSIRLTECLMKEEPSVRDLKIQTLEMREQVSRNQERQDKARGLMSQSKS
jgi:hypothetical protein